MVVMVVPGSCGGVGGGIFRMSLPGPLSVNRQLR